MKREQTHGPDILDGHLGGCSTGGDSGTYYPLMWTHIVRTHNVKSVLDIGCGRGFSADYFKDPLAVEVCGVEGSREAVLQSLIPEDVVQHDYSLGPYTPQKDYDLGWCCEFVEHVEEQYAPNFIQTFTKCKMLALTYASPGQGGHHHVNENTFEYWREKIEAAGFRYDEALTQEFRAVAQQDADEQQKANPDRFMIPHFVRRGLVFLRNDVS